MVCNEDVLSGDKEAPAVMQAEVVAELEVAVKTDGEAANLKPDET